jgi:quercetin dioxygenase-like cupin family protein
MPGALGGTMPRIQLAPHPTAETPRTAGFGRRLIFESEEVRLGETRVEPGARSPWHHHGQRTLYGFVVAGELALEFGPGGGETASPRAGEYFRIPPGLVHRDVNRGAVEVVVVNVSVGVGPVTIDVPGPDD